MKTTNHIIPKTLILALGFILTAGMQNTFAQPAQFKVVGFETSWDGSVGSIQFNKLTHVIYAFLVPNSDGSLQAIDDPSKLQSLVSSAHAAGVKVIISCQTTASTWGTLAYNSGYVSTFVNNVMGFVNQYGLDGVDIDWEFPSPAPSASANNYANLLAQLSSTLHGHGLLLTADVASWGSEASGVLSSVFNSVDWLNIMDYDNSNGVGQSTLASVTTALNYWEGQGLPASKAVMGVPFYGDPNGQYTFAQLVSMGANPYDDSWNGYGYNGITTIQEKAQLCLQDGLGGMMIWELGGDATGSDSLLSAMYAAIVPIGQTVSFQAQDNNEWVTCNDGNSPLIADQSAANGWEQFVVVDESSTFGYGYISLQATANNDYVSADDAGSSPLIANRTSASTWETFYWQNVGYGAVNLRSYINGLWVCADDDGADPLIANRTTPQLWETFNVKIW